MTDTARMTAYRKPWATYLNEILFNRPGDTYSLRDMEGSFSEGWDIAARETAAERDRLKTDVTTLTQALQSISRICTTETEQGTVDDLADIAEIVDAALTAAPPIESAIPQRVTHALDSIMTYLAEERKDYEQCSESERRDHIYSDVLALGEWLKTEGGAQ
jgi:hypothetical protein